MGGPTEDKFKFGSASRLCNTVAGKLLTDSLQTTANCFGIEQQTQHWKANHCNLEPIVLIQGAELKLMRAGLRCRSVAKCFHDIREPQRR